MGCIVNGLGEGREADLAIVGDGKNLVLIMKNGKIVEKMNEKKVLELFKKELEKYL